MAVNIIPDPFSLVMEAMWAAAQNSNVLFQQIKPGNLIRFDKPTDRSPIKTSVLAADLPELFLVPTSLAGNDTNLHDSSASSRVCMTFHWLLNSGDLRTNAYVMPIGWAIVCAMAGWQNFGNYTALTWQGKSFVKKVDVRGGSVGYHDLWRKQGITGWTFLSEVEVTMSFATSDMITYGGA